MTLHAIVFDAYGTLFDVYSISALAEKRFPGRGASLAELWRDKQIEYTRLRTMCSTYKPFWEVTQDALVFACRRLGLDLTLDAQNALMGQYARLQAFPENLGVLRKLKDMGLKLAILSNGNPQMLESAVSAAGMEGIFHHILSVDAVKKYKTAPEAYQMAPDVFGLSPKNMLFVSSNGWDVCGAAWFGYTTFWVNRAAAPLEELGVKPDAEGRDMKAMLDFVKKKLRENK
ncbi:haloacid dehalogenase type II [Noviherbaspirillum aridicola]|uniref:(S)-2-haloacid dehalogenase n=1 Tax=Noviherbaspirillum aridicola TaxID=2849687 RepID=A0ABQ4Q3W0_9BURK|nr:haloacid dehalogenase type II [Noviherbaspirillum aridicola]GIZ51500.1 haloacid dehalogenase [Noviherbaspirillum aridicola]